ncbi:ATP-dependent helicase NAM7, partial [Cichlidogyrus casuarinus]
MDAYDAYGPNSQALTFLDTDHDMWGGTQAEDAEPAVFSLPPAAESQSQTAVAPIKTVETSVDEVEPVEWACAYCGIDDPAAVVQCKATGKWFCNGRGNCSGSHIVIHLVRARSKEVSLHQDSPLKDSLLECYVCGSQNVFQLGFVPAKSESVVVLLCRRPCAHQNHDMNWDPQQWQPLIQERQFLPWLVKVPSPEQQFKAKQISAKEINKLEELWKRENSELDDEPFIEPRPVPLQFQSSVEYRDIFAPLISFEAEYNRRIKESIRLENVTVRWETNLNKKKVAYFCIPGANEGPELRIATGDELYLCS